MKKIYTLLLAIPVALDLYGANELYVNGSNLNTPENFPELFINTGQLFVNGDTYINQGNLVNKTGTLEMTGNFTNIPNTFYSPADSNQNGYKSNGKEMFYGRNQQIVSGNMSTGTINSGGYYKNQFYNLEIYKSDSSSNNKYLSINTNVLVANSINFNTTTPNTLHAGSGTNYAVIQTDTSKPSNINNYKYFIYLKNPAISSFTNYAPISANSNRLYIEGKLKRQVNSTGTYDFPIGFRPGVKDGMEGISITFNTTPSNAGILSYIRDATTNLNYRNVLCDIGKDPGNGAQNFALCSGSKDNIYDLYYLDQDITHEWMAIPDSGSFNYNVNLYPGPNLDNLIYYRIPTPCDPLYRNKYIRVVSKNGVLGGTTQIGPGNLAPWLIYTSYIWCAFDDSTLQISLNNQTNMANASFRIHGTSILTGQSSALPVELTEFSIKTINNEYFKLSWKTLSESNNAGFELERSTDGIHFEKITWINGHGTSSVPHNYLYDDFDVSPPTNYYYRLKQVNSDGSFEYSGILHGKLQSHKSFEVSDPIPNPASTTSAIHIYCPEPASIAISVFDVLGRFISGNNIELPEGLNLVDLHCEDLAFGTYIITVQYHEISISKKLIKN